MKSSEPQENTEESKLADSFATIITLADRQPQSCNISMADIGSPGREKNRYPDLEAVVRMYEQLQSENADLKRRLN